MNPLPYQEPHATCLVIDNAKQIQETAILLQAMGASYDFQFCSDYQRALSILSQDTIDIILLSFFPTSSELSGEAFFQIVHSLYPVVLLGTQPSSLTQLSVGPENFFAHLPKPIQAVQLRLIFQKLQSIQRSVSVPLPNQTLFIKIGRLLRKFKISDILYIQAYAAYSKVVTVTGTFTVNESITSLENRLPKTKFSRIHKSYIVNFDHLVGYERRHALIDTIKLPIGAKYRKQFQSIFSLFEV